MEIIRDILTAVGLLAILAIVWACIFKFMDFIGDIKRAIVVADRVPSSYVFTAMETSINQLHNRVMELEGKKKK